MTEPRQDELLDPTSCDVLDLVQEHHADLPPKERWPATLRELVEVLAAYNERVLRMKPHAAADDAMERTVLIADYLGGRFVYLPRGESLRVAVRDALIYRLSDQLPVHEIAERYGLNEIRIYQIVAREKRRAVRRMQGRLFEDAVPAPGGTTPAGGGGE